eukprot:CAMPEP_0196669290 /NCGR_PEP_ID=MMETSP1090-20130531/531_1 /TAXON_ID=37098 /ORGANISM="Isochrysis sp, Strain CCMP1244" /LENGTH=77 /DNA_ID=CAMNT_0042006805 /DNA_START=9 /DNA_END=239 /DNA_ORIENTATION=-
MTPVYPARARWRCLTAPAPRPRSSWAAAGWTAPPRGQAALLAPAPGKDDAVGGEGDALVLSSRHSDDALASQGLDLL